MANRQLLQIAVCSVAAILCCGNGLYAQQTAHTNKQTFRIPYHIDPQIAAQLKPREVQLYVSSDRGQTWQLSSTSEPTITHFRFKTAIDGEYWFDVRTVDSNNITHPPTTTYKPSLKVIVDSAAPKIELNLTQVDSTKVGVQWSVRDTGLLLNSMVLEYLEPTAVEWQPMGIVASTAGGTMWKFNRTGIAGVRCRVQDKAGNVATAEKKIDLSIVRPQPVVELQPATRPPLAANPSVTTPQGESATVNTNPTVVESSTVNLPMPEPGRAVPNSIPAPSSSTTTGSASTKESPDVRSERTVPDTELLPEPPTRKHRVVNSNTFRINYKLDGIGPSGVSRIEFFITENDGIKWWKYGDDQDRQAPFQIQVPHDGVYGFAIRASSGAGLAGKAPSPGEKPEVVVEVDTTRPFVQLNPFDPNTAPGKRILEISWTVSDTNLAQRPVGLYFARQKQGPWESISGWVENSGQYTWKIGPEVPTNVFLRIAARDTAGNMTQLETQKPIVVDTARPSARIVDVQAFGGQ